MRTRAFALFVLAGSAACEDVIVDPGSGLNQSAGATAIPPPEIPTECPPKQPDEGASCDQAGSACEYGSSADMSCNTTLTCLGDGFSGQWHARPAGVCNTHACPAGPTSSIDGTPCTIPVDSGIATDADELVCNMTDGLCACTTGRDAMHAHERRWVCVRPAPDCPTRRPMAGSSCTWSIACDYGNCGWKRGRLMQCERSVWISRSASCE